MWTYMIYAGSSYIAVSMFLFTFPNLIHKKQTKQIKVVEEAIKNNTILNIAHRGGPRYTVENTIQAFKKVIHSCDMIEMDVCETKDKILVVHHDPSLKRTLGINANVSDYNFNELPGFQEEIQLDFANNMKIKSCNERIPSLEQVFKQFPNVPMNIQLKTPTESALNQFARLIKLYNRTQITIGGIRNNSHSGFKEKNPQIRTFMTDYEVFRILIGYYTGLLPFMSLDDCTLQIPLYTEDYYARRVQISNNLNRQKKFFMGIKFLNATIKPLIWHLKQRNIGTFYWVCNNQQEFNKAMNSGVCGIMTDAPFLLYEKLESKKNI